ncbi:CRISPR-associated endonuclease Cas2 [Calditerrivibrio nitroreducens]|uniref:CRISPR-associated endoribonuclease Cas2 n=1 Tax=Calditerrivibrio nitroreducens (strain DSM 19672 / NBRC 101217 / Yu37-1) TaxID=768670 RepID=E4TFD2_CALNY|nr:CRISPR-associated endonuclease Cas2 [Calditerrivibrio nitroreducens]ADR19505.1 CRISPR-associated protein Cas2 [Calditerrivibrio nitroreducens DSM 19672]
MEKFYVISYDIADDRKRYRVDKLLKNNGMRVQKSVFECRLTDAQFLTLKMELGKIINYNTDSVRFYYLCKHCVDMIEYIGNSVFLEKNDFLII